MRSILYFWAAPMGIFWGWFYLSANDMSFGYTMLTRKMHDFAFQMYGSILGIDPQTIPGLVARACVFDTIFIFAILAFRRRKPIMAWLRSFRAETAVEAQPSA